MHRFISEEITELFFLEKAPSEKDFSVYNSYIGPPGKMLFMIPCFFSLPRTEKTNQERLSADQLIRRNWKLNAILFSSSCSFCVTRDGLSERRTSSSLLFNL